MEFLDNVGRDRLGDALAKSIDEGAKLSIISSYFTVFAFSELKEELEKVDSVRFLFSEPTFVKRMATDKDPRQFAYRNARASVAWVAWALSLRCATISINVPLLASAPNGCVLSASFNLPR